MLLYVLWNATIYPGSYGAWAYADVWQHPEWHQRVLALQSPTERQARYADAFQETVRLWPVASLVRALSEPVEVTSNGCVYSVGPGDVLGVFPWSRNRDPDRHSEPERWDADRWTRHESSEGLFGRGAFGCVAVRFNQLLFGEVLDGLFQRFDYQTSQALPDRRCRVHLTYPREAWSGRLVTRQDGS